MNIEYKRMPDDTIFVTDELGHITQRNNNTSRDELLIENKIEVIDKNILDANKELDNLKGVIRLDLAIVLAFTGAVIPTLIQAIYLKIVPNLAWCMVTLFDLIFIIMHAKCKQEKISLESKIAKAQELRKEYEKESKRTIEAIQKKYSSSLLFPPYPPPFPVFPRAGGNFMTFFLAKIVCYDSFICRS